MKQKEKGLKEEYRFREVVWNYWLKWWIKLAFVKIGWIHLPLISYPLVIDLELGTMKYHYYKYGASHVWDRAAKYNHVLVDRMKGVEDEQFEELFTEDRLFEDQLEKEFLEHERDTNSW